MKIATQRNVSAAPSSAARRRFTWPDAPAAVIVAMNSDGASPRPRTVAAKNTIATIVIVRPRHDVAPNGTRVAINAFNAIAPPSAVSTPPSSNGK